MRALDHTGHRFDAPSYDRDRRMEHRVTLAAMAGLTVLWTVWASLGAVGQAIVLAAAVVAGLATIWRILIAPVIHVVSDAAEAYTTLTGMDEKLDRIHDQAEKRHQDLDDRVTLLERLVDELAKHLPGRR